MIRFNLVFKWVVIGCAFLLAATTVFLFYTNYLGVIWWINKPNSWCGPFTRIGFRINETAIYVVNTLNPMQCL